MRKITNLLVYAALPTQFPEVQLICIQIEDETFLFVCVS